MSGCINSVRPPPRGHIGILGVDKDGKERYQITLGGADGTALSGPAIGGKVVGPSFTAAEVPDVIEALLEAPSANCASPARSSSTRCAASATTPSSRPPTAPRPKADQEALAEEQDRE